MVRQKRLRHFVRPVYRALLRRAVAVIVYTANYANHSEELAAAARPLSIIPHGTNASELAIRPEEVERARDKKIELFGDRPVVAFLGRHVAFKGVDILIRAIKDLPGVALMVGGSGPLTGQWRQLSVDLGLADRVHFLGNVKGAGERRVFFAMTDLFVLPSLSRSESFGQVLVEAQLADTVTITTEIGSGNTDIVRDSDTGFVVPPNDPEALGRCVMAALADPTRLADIRGRARASALANFTAEACGARILALFDQLECGTCLRGCERTRDSAVALPREVGHRQ
jgi:rhamnosyl/mannosyltransferase